MMLALKKKNSMTCETEDLSENVENTAMKKASFSSLLSELCWFLSRNFHWT